MTSLVKLRTSCVGVALPDKLQQNQLFSKIYEGGIFESVVHAEGQYVERRGEGCCAYGKSALLVSAAIDEIIGFA
jgi:hypothetical protein